MEHPSDPEDYMSDSEEYPSIWEWPEVHDFALRHGLETVKLDQGACGHSRVKPTTLTGLDALKELDSMKADGAKEEMEVNLGPRMRQTSTWSAWAPGVVRAIQLAIMKLQDVTPELKKLSMDDWRKHVRQNHIPFRRDRQLCIEEMGQDLPHGRRGLGGESVYVLAVDKAGPFIKGEDLGGGRNAMAKYALVATVPIPVSSGGLQRGGPQRAGGAHGPGDVPSSTAPAGPSVHGSSQVHRSSQECADADQSQHGDAQDQLLGAAENGGAPHQNLLGDPLGLVPEADESALVDIDDGDTGEGALGEADKRIVEKMNARWREHRDAATEPVEVQNICSMMEPLPSRKIKDILEALDRLWAKYRALGVPLYRFHSDRAKEFISRPVRTWVARDQMLWQTATGGDDSAQGTAQESLGACRGGSPGPSDLHGPTGGGGSQLE